MPSSRARTLANMTASPREHLPWDSSGNTFVGQAAGLPDASAGQRPAPRSYSWTPPWGTSASRHGKLGACIDAHGGVVRAGVHAGRHPADAAAAQVADHGAAQH